MATRTRPIKTEKDINAAARAHKALELRLQRKTYDEIAQEVGYTNRSTARQIVKRELAHTVIEDVEELRQQEALTLDLLQAECMLLFLNRKNKARLFALDRIMLIMDRRAKLLNLDKMPEEEAIKTILVREMPPDYLGLPAPVESTIEPVKTLPENHVPIVETTKDA